MKIQICPPSPRAFEPFFSRARRRTGLIAAVMVESERPFASRSRRFDEAAMHNLAERVFGRSIDIASQLTNPFLLDAGDPWRKRLGGDPRADARLPWHGRSSFSLRTRPRIGQRNSGCPLDCAVRDGSRILPSCAGTSWSPKFRGTRPVADHERSQGRDAKKLGDERTKPVWRSGPPQIAAQARSFPGESRLPAPHQRYRSVGSTRCQDIDTNAARFAPAAAQNTAPPCRR
jgi:hypothetical protein